MKNVILIICLANGKCNITVIDSMESKNGMITRTLSSKHGWIPCVETSSMLSDEQVSIVVIQKIYNFACNMFT